MLFNSLGFLVFMVVVVITYWILPHRFRWIMLLIASYYFYMLWNLELVFLIVGTTLTSYATGLIIAKSNNKKVKKAALAFNIITALGVLFFFKYFNFFSQSITEIIRMFGIQLNDVILQLILPIGVSFYTFQTLSYSIDVYRGKIEAEKHLGYYALYVSFFPSLVAGPIERPGDFLPQIKDKRNFDSDNFKSGLEFLLVGFFKKVVVADLIAIFVNTIFNNPAEAGGLSTLIATVLFAVQILCDFDGYTNIAIGVAKLMNINLTDNFDNPYGATSIKAFWGKWHITLSTWFRDYLYIPLGGNRVSKSRWYVNIFIVFLVSGLWHGANFTFIIWGAIHGLYQILESVLAKPATKVYEKLKINTNGEGFKIYRVIRTFSLVCFAWIFFRANSVSDAFVLIGKLFTDWGVTSTYFANEFAKLGMDMTALLLTGCIIILLYIISKNKNHLFGIKNKDERKVRINFNTRLAINSLITVAIAISWIYGLYITSGENGFIYFQF